MSGFQHRIYSFRLFHLDNTHVDEIRAQNMPRRIESCESRLTRIQIFVDHLKQLCETENTSNV